MGKETKKGLVGRVPQQIVRLPLAPATRAIFQKLIGSGGAKSLASYYGPNCLDQVRADLGDLARLQKDSYKHLVARGALSMKGSAEAFEGSTRAELRDIVHAGLPPGTARKGLYAELVVNGYGFEAVALLTEHGTNALLPGGPYSLAPYEIYCDLGREALDVAHAGAVSTVLDRLAEHSLAAQGGAQTLLNLGDATKALYDDEVTCVELPGFSALPLPTPGQWHDFHAASDGFKRFMTRAQSASIDQLKTALAFALCCCGLPLKNLRRRALHYRFGSFILPRDLPGFFVGLTRQNDRGLGLVALPLEQSEWAIRRILELLGDRSGIGPHQRLFGDYKFSREALAKFVRRCLAEKDGARRWDDTYLLAMIDRCSTFVSLMQHGGFLTFAMTIVDKLNYIFVDKPKKRYQVSIDQPIRIENFNEPQPDVALYKRGVENRHPTPEDIYLVIEVADATLDYDSGDKLRAYEKAGIKEYWIIDVGKKAVNIYKPPAQEHNYARESHTYGVIAPQAFPDVSVGLEDIF